MGERLRYSSLGASGKGLEAWDPSGSSPTPRLSHWIDERSDLAKALPQIVFEQKSTGTGFQRGIWAYSRHLGLLPSVREREEDPPGARSSTEVERKPHRSGKALGLPRHVRALSCVMQGHWLRPAGLLIFVLDDPAVYGALAQAVLGT